jgi:hypothetical protein
MTDLEKRPSQGKDVGQDPGGDHPPPSPDSMRSYTNRVPGDTQKWSVLMESRSAGFPGSMLGHRGRPKKGEEKPAEGRIKYGSPNCSLRAVGPRGDRGPCA